MSDEEIFEILFRAYLLLKDGKVVDQKRFAERQIGIAIYWMEKNMHERKAGQNSKGEEVAASLDAEATPTLTTKDAARLLNRSPHTLHIWAMNGSGPVQPLRVGGRLAWPAGKIKKLLNGG